MMTQPTIMTALVMTIGISAPLVVPAKPTEGHTIYIYNHTIPYLCKLHVVMGFSNVCFPSLCPTFCHLIKSCVGLGMGLVNLFCFTIADSSVKMDLFKCIYDHGQSGILLVMQPGVGHPGKCCQHH